VVRLGFVLESEHNHASQKGAKQTENQFQKKTVLNIGLYLSYPWREGRKGGKKAGNGAPSGRNINSQIVNNSATTPAGLNVHYLRAMK
jgi:hypothetical protein